MALSLAEADVVHSPWMQWGYVCTDTSAGEERLSEAAEAAWHRDRTVEAAVPATGARACSGSLRVWNGTDSYGKLSVARNWYAKLQLARWRRSCAVERNSELVARLSGSQDAEDGAVGAPEAPGEQVERARRVDKFLSRCDGTAAASAPSSPKRRTTR